MCSLCDVYWARQALRRTLTFATRYGTSGPALAEQLRKDAGRGTAGFVAPLDPVEFHQDEPPFFDSALKDKTAPANGDGGTWSYQLPGSEPPVTVESVSTIVRRLSERIDAEMLLLAKRDFRKLRLRTARQELQRDLQRRIEQFEEAFGVTVKGVTLAHGMRLLPALNGDRWERTNYVITEVVE